MSGDRTKCRSCVDSDSDQWDNLWDEEGCLDGEVYGYCSSDLCGGLCESFGTCPCTCHTMGSGRCTEGDPTQCDHSSTGGKCDVCGLAQRVHPGRDGVS